MYGDLTIEKIKKEEVSRRRNELIADMFRRVHFVENWGKGIKLILSKEPTADFKVVAGIFITTFKRKGVDRGVVKGVEKLSENEQKIIDLILKDSSISKAEMVEKGGLSKKTVEYNLESLKKKGILKRIGGAKGGRWEIIEKS